MQGYEAMSVAREPVGGRVELRRALGQLMKLCKSKIIYYLKKS